MALPVLIKTYQFNVNQTLFNVSGILGSRMPALGAVNSMIGFASNPWVVWGSAGTGAGAPDYGNNDGVDRWLNNLDVHRISRHQPAER